MHRFYLPSEKIIGPSLSLESGDAHHAADVLRLRKGDEVTVLDGAGRECRCEVQSVQRRDVHLRILQTMNHDALPFAVTLIQAVPKGKTFETIVQKATELGAARIIPLLSSRVVMQLDADGAEAKIEKWHHVAVEAIKQCGSPWLPVLEKPITLAEMLHRPNESEISFVGFLGEGTQHPKRFFQDFAREHGRPPKSVRVWVGPEGDFSRDEIDAILAHGAKPISMGPLVLRSDTAAIYALSFINYELQTGGTVAPALPES